MFSDEECEMPAVECEESQAEYWQRILSSAQDQTFPGGLIPASGFRPPTLLDPADYTIEAITPNLDPTYYDAGEFANITTNTTTTTTTTTTGPSTPETAANMVSFQYHGGGRWEIGTTERITNV